MLHSNRISVLYSNGVFVLQSNRISVLHSNTYSVNKSPTPVNAIYLSIHDIHINVITTASNFSEVRT